MVETMRMEGHTALVHTAAASNLGQMLVKICLADDVPLVNVVRRPEQADLLRGLGAVHVCDSSSPTFLDDLTAALTATGATLAFDAIGGGRWPVRSWVHGGGRSTPAVASTAATAATSQAGLHLRRSRPQPHRAHPQLRHGVGHRRLAAHPVPRKLGLPGMLRLRQRVVDELTTTFASHYTDEVSLAEALSLDAIRTYAKQATGQKFLIRPNGR
jgi:NADPH2:quinone reductase